MRLTPRLTACSVAVAACLTGCTADAPDGKPKVDFAPFSFAVVGDVPYTDAEVQEFSGRIRLLAERTGVDLITHLGDITDDNCTTEYFQQIKSSFEGAGAAILYTPGDNEWADCKGLDPQERLAALREVFFGTAASYDGDFPRAAPNAAYPENVIVDAEGATFVAMHLVGPRNNLSASSPVVSPRNSEVAARTTAATALLLEGSSRALHRGSDVLVVLTQANMFDATLRGDAHRQAFAPVVAALAAAARDFDGNVYLFNGDTHVAANDRPLAESEWLDYYAVGEPVPNLLHYTIEGGAGVDEALVVSLDNGLVRVRDLAFE